MTEKWMADVKVLVVQVLSTQRRKAIRRERKALILGAMKKGIASPPFGGGD